MVGIDVQFNIISYAVISTKFETNNNIIDSFIPLIEHVLLSLNDDCIEEININNSYEEIYGYRIHSAILTQLLKKLQRQGKIERLKRERIQINKTKLQSYESKEKYEKNLRGLISEIDLFLKKKGKALNRIDIPKNIIAFLRKNALGFNSFMNYKSNLDDCLDDNSIFNDLIEFLIEERKNNTFNYEFIKDIYSGILLSSIIVSEESASYNISEKFQIENVLLDSNYIFRLLDLQTSLEHQAAKDTYETLKEIDCNFWICKETLKQIADTIRSIISNYSESANTFLRIYGDERFTGLASACIRKNLNASKLETIINDLEDTLTNDYNIRIIDEDKHNIELIDTKSDEFNSLYKIKPDSSEFGIAHDLLLIHIVKTYRPKSFYKSEQANWWVLTDDYKLTNWNSKNTSTPYTPECITESQLATVMWLCNPKTCSSDGLFNTIIALRSQGMAGNYEYDKISKEIERQKERFSENKPNLKKLSLVLSQRLLSIDDVLNSNENELDSIFDNYLVQSQDLLEKNKLTIEEKEQKIGEQKEKNKELSQKISTSLSLLSEKSEKIIILLKSQKKDIEDKIEKNDIDIKKLEKKLSKWKTISKSIVFLILITSLKLLQPIVNHTLGEWYKENEVAFNVTWPFLCVLLGWYGINIEKIDYFVILIEKILVFFFGKKVAKQIDALEKANSSHYKSIENLQDEIDKELQC